ncbi:hypothetical protein [Actinoplanes sp. NPDC049802]|uniref:hypothetical protein n=1 Tax=Actinoplanes sp. NPDC049802 TaxID=3154742 RepID=UPI0033EF812D
MSVKTGQAQVENPGSRTRVKPPKSYNGFRTLVLDAVALEMLAAMASRYLFTGRTGQLMRPDNLTDRFNQLAVAAKVRPLGPHQIRHMLASNLLSRPSFDAWSCPAVDRTGP